MDNQAGTCSKSSHDIDLGAQEDTSLEDSEHDVGEFLCDVINTVHCPPPPVFYFSQEVLAMEGEILKELQDADEFQDEYKKVIAHIKKQADRLGRRKKPSGRTYKDLQLTEVPIEEWQDYIVEQKKAKEEAEAKELERKQKEAEAKENERKRKEAEAEETRRRNDPREYEYSGSSDESSMVYAGIYHSRSKNPYAKTHDQIKKEKEREKLETQHYLRQMREDYLEQRQKEKELEQKKLKEQGLLPDEVQLSEEEYQILIRNKQLEIEILEKKSEIRIEEIRLQHLRRMEKEKGFPRYLKKKEVLSLHSPRESMVKVLSVCFAKPLSKCKSIIEELRGKQEGKTTQHMCKEYLQELEERTCLHKLTFPLETKKQDLEADLLKMKRLKLLMETDNRKREEEKSESAHKKEEEVKKDMKFKQIKEEGPDYNFSADELSDSEEDRRFFMSMQPGFENHEYRDNIKKKAFDFKSVNLKNLNHKALVSLEIEKKQKQKQKIVQREIQIKKNLKNLEQNKNAIQETNLQDVADEVANIKSDSCHFGCGKGKPIQKLNMQLFKQIFQLEKSK